MKFIDTDAGRQLLIDYFHAKTAVEFVDPNFLVWQDEWADFSLLYDIQQLYEKWIAKGCLKWIDNPHYFSFTQAVLDYLAEKQDEGQTATYPNYEEYGFGNGFAFQWEYEEEYLESLKSSVAQEYLDLIEKYKED